MKKSVYMDVGMYDLSYTIRMDLDFFLRAIKEYRVKFVKKPIVLYLTDGISSQLSNRFHFKLEEKKANLYHKREILMKQAENIMKRLSSKIHRTRTPQL